MISTVTFLEMEKKWKETKFDFEFGFPHHFTVPKQDQLLTSNLPEKQKTDIG